ncbi:hypothetical protein KSP39_PZI019389 [Platanthera zijinensis]|uniref:Uncharacterized protein n=1 Tax=Platanthera zijinensis TaxID=2320716 RepID=A0AAP0B2K4_9ASPA
MNQEASLKAAYLYRIRIRYRYVPDTRWTHWNEIRKANSNLPVIGKTGHDFKEEIDADAEDDDADNLEDSDGDEFEQETG